MDPTVREVLECQLSSWYPLFRSLPENELGRKNATIESIIIELPDDFRDFLLSDGVRLPVGATTVSSFVPPERDDASDPEEASGRQQFAFPELNETIRKAIHELGVEGFNG